MFRRIKEVSAIKCIIDFRIKFYMLTGHKRSSTIVKYLRAAIELHKSLSSDQHRQLNAQLVLWREKHAQNFVISFDCRKRYIDHYRDALEKYQRG